MKVTILIVCLLAFLYTFSTQTFAADFTVNLTTDEFDASTADTLCDTDLAAVGLQCTLRAAVQQANALSSNDRTLFSLPANSIITLTIANGGEIPIEDNGTLEIVGTGANNLTINGGEGPNRIFRTNFATVTISGVTLTGGNATSAGLSGLGGAIFAGGGSLMLDSVHITGNSASNAGGGVYFIGSGTPTIINSTFSANTAFNCGGFVNEAGFLIVVNSTISGNRADNVGGGFCNQSDATLRNATVTDNSATNGGGIYQGNGTLHFGNTIVAGNFVQATGFAPEIQFAGGTITSSGGNLVSNNSGVEAAFPAGNPNANNDKVGTFDSVINPLLAALFNNGGPTRTHALLVGSPAIDAGLSANVSLTTDQRGAGFSRIVDGNSDGSAIVDIGAFERQLVATAATVSVSGRVLSSRGRGVSNAVVYLTNQRGEIQTARTNRSGYYTFQEITAGESYIFNVYAKRYQFNAQVITLTEDLAELNFTAQ
jgi:parallel beta-helix repeat protein